MSFNAFGYDLNDRVQSFYLLYHKILAEVVWFLDPDTVVFVKSHDGGNDDIRSTVNFNTIL